MVHGATRVAWRCGTRPRNVEPSSARAADARRRGPGRPEASGAEAAERLPRLGLCRVRSAWAPLTRQRRRTGRPPGGGGGCGRRGRAATTWTAGPARGRTAAVPSPSASTAGPGGPLDPVGIDDQHRPGAPGVPADRRRGPRRMLGADLDLVAHQRPAVVVHRQPARHRPALLPVTGPAPAPPATPASPPRPAPPSPGPGGRSRRRPPSAPAASAASRPPPPPTSTSTTDGAGPGQDDRGGHRLQRQLGARADHDLDPQDVAAQRPAGRRRPGAPASPPSAGAPAALRPEARQPGAAPARRPPPPPAPGRSRRAPPGGQLRPAPSRPPPTAAGSSTSELNSTGRSPRLAAASRAITPRSAPTIERQVGLVDHQQVGRRDARARPCGAPCRRRPRRSRRPAGRPGPG